MNAYPIGNDLTVKWSLLYSDGSVFPLSNYDYELSYRTNRGNKVVTDTSVIAVDENILTWTFKGDEQAVSGRYTICLKITLSGSKVIELQYDNAFMLSPLSGFKGAGSEIVLQSYCDAIDLKDAVLQARKAMDIAAGSKDDAAISAAAAKAAKEAAEVTAAKAKTDAAAAQQAAQTASDHIVSLEQAIADLPDGQAVTAKVAEHTTKLSELVENDANQERIINGLKDQVNNYKPIEIFGNVTNAADEEDITSEDNLLKLKDRSALNGMGYVILRNNKTFAEQVTQANTIYEIRYDFDLGGVSKTLPNNCVLKFEGGKISNGTVIGTKTFIDAPLAQVFEKDVVFGGTFIGEGRVEWMGCFPNSDICVGNAINKLSEVYKSIVLSSGSFLSYERIHVKKTMTLSGAGARNTTISFPTMEDDGDAVMIGYVQSSPSDYDRLWHVCIKSLAISIEANDVKRTTCLHIGKTTEFKMHDVEIRNLNVRANPYTEDELLNPCYYANYAVVVDAQSECMQIHDFLFSGDIALWVKRRCDLLSLYNGQLNSNANGLAPMYGMVFGDNNMYQTIDLALGYYGICYTDEQADATMPNYANSIGSTTLKNLRIEQTKGDRYLVIKKNATSLSFKSLVFDSVVFPMEKDFLFVDDKSLQPSFIGFKNCRFGNVVNRFSHDFIKMIDGRYLTISFQNCNECNMADGVSIPSTHEIIGFNIPPYSASFSQVSIADNLIIRPKKRKEIFEYLGTCHYKSSFSEEFTATGTGRVLTGIKDYVQDGIIYKFLSLIKCFKVNFDYCGSQGYEHAEFIVNVKEGILEEPILIAQNSTREGNPIFVSGTSTSGVSGKIQVYVVNNASTDSSINYVYRPNAGTTEQDGIVYTTVEIFTIVEMYARITDYV